MKDYIGVKVVAAEPMSRGEYNAYRGWKIPSDENPADEGYHIRYSDNMRVGVLRNSFMKRIEDVII